MDEIDKLEKIYDVVETFNISDYSTMLITNEFYNISNFTSHMDQIQPCAWWSHPSMLLISSIHSLSFMCSYSLIPNFFHVEFHPTCNYIHVLYIVHVVVNVIHMGWFSMMLILTTCVSFILVVNFILRIILICVKFHPCDQLASMWLNSSMIKFSFMINLL